MKPRVALTPKYPISEYTGLQKWAVHALFTVVLNVISYFVIKFSYNNEENENKLLGVDCLIKEGLVSFQSFT